MPIVSFLVVLPLMTSQILKHHHLRLEIHPQGSLFEEKHMWNTYILGKLCFSCRHSRQPLLYLILLASHALTSRVQSKVFNLCISWKSVAYWLRFPQHAAVITLRQTWHHGTSAFMLSRPQAGPYHAKAVVFFRNAFGHACWPQVGTRSRTQKVIGRTADPHLRKQLNCPLKLLGLKSFQTWASMRRVAITS